MNNFGLIGSTSGIDIGEVSAIKKMILQKAQEKHDIATQSVQDDVMDVARTSVNNKPKLGGLTFNNQYKVLQNIEETTPKVEEQPIVNDKTIPPSEEENKAPERQLKHNVASVQDNVYTNHMRDDVMNAALNGYRQKSSLADSLKFLNTQAAISLVSKTHSKIV